MVKKKWHEQTILETEREKQAHIWQRFIKCERSLWAMHDNTIEYLNAGIGNFLGKYNLKK